MARIRSARNTSSRGTSAAPSRAPTPFETRLYALCSKIPRGKVSTYGAMAKVLNSSPRAVGQALRRNPFAPKVPCHRVIAASLTLGGFKGHWGAACATVQSKKAMLKEEGVDFDDAGRLVSMQAVLDAAGLSKLL